MCSKQVENILKKNYTDGVFHTHVSLIQPKGKFLFNREGFENFWKLYCELIKKNKEAVVGIAEKPQSYLPVLADIDIKILETEDMNFGEHIYNTEQLQSVIEIYQSVLRNIVEDCTDEQLLCVVLEKPIYRITKNENTYTKNGFHLHFPNIFLKKIDQEVQVIPRVQDLINESQIFINLGFEDSGKVIDSACCKVPWLLYGSRKSQEMSSYLVTHIINHEGKKISLEKSFRHYRIYDKKEKLINIKDDIEFYLPRILSIMPCGRETSELRPGLISPLKEKIKEKRRKNQQTQLKISTKESLEISKQLLPMLAQFRSEDRNEWMTIGWILYNIGEGSGEGLEQWCEFSSRDKENYDEGTCIFEWEKMTKKDLTLGTLRYYAGVDNPDEYNNFKKIQAESHVKDSLSGSHNDIAKVLYEEYGNEFVCASISNKTWFQFCNHKWQEIEEGVYLRQKISKEISKKYVDMGKELYMEMSKAEDKSEESMLNNRLKQVQKIISNLKASPYKNNIMREAMEVFYDRRFREKLNKNCYLIGFKNGVYDLKLNTIRPGRPEDFISKAMPIEYKEFDETDEEVLNVHDYLEKVFPDKSVRNYFLDVSSDVFVGGNHQKQVYFWTGEGDNAKSVTQSLFEKMLGELAIKFSTTLITGKKTANGSANPELSRAGDGIRWATLEEPDGDEQINIGTLKNLSGNDSYWARDLFQKGKEAKEITPMFKLIFICNKLPKLKYSDKATWNRIRVIPFESTFVKDDKDCPDTYEEQLRQKRFPMDKQFSKKIPGMIQAFAWVLLRHRQQIKIRIEPPKVTQATEIYRKQNDIYRQYIEEIIAEDKSVTLSLQELYSSFKEWHREGFPNYSLPIKNEIKEYFERVWGECKGNKWKGYKIRNLQQEIDEGSAIVLGKEDLVDYKVKNLPPM